MCIELSNNNHLLKLLSSILGLVFMFISLSIFFISSLSFNFWKGSFFHYKYVFKSYETHLLYTQISNWKQRSTKIYTPLLQTTFDIYTKCASVNSKYKLQIFNRFAFDISSMFIFTDNIALNKSVYQ